MNVSAALKETSRSVAGSQSLLSCVLLVLQVAISLVLLMSYAVVRRTSEIGIRMAFGARRRDVLALVMGESMTLVAIGVAIGVVTALAARRLVATMLFGLAATDGVTMTGAVTLMVLVCAVAGYIPARRAAQVDPLVALRYD
jgi:ABC-type antimicrobial peptide transport system permease subunit